MSNNIPNNQGAIKLSEIFTDETLSIINNNIGADALSVIKQSYELLSDLFRKNNYILHSKGTVEWNGTYINLPSDTALYFKILQLDDFSNIPYINFVLNPPSSQNLQIDLSNDNFVYIKINKNNLLTYLKNQTSTVDIAIDINETSNSIASLQTIKLDNTTGMPKILHTNTIQNTMLLPLVLKFTWSDSSTTYNDILWIPHGIRWPEGTQSTLGAVIVDKNETYHNYTANTFAELQTYLNLLQSSGGSILINGEIEIDSELQIPDGVKLYSRSYKAPHNFVIETDDVIYAITVDSSGNLYVGGKFQYINGYNIPYLAKYTPSTNTWSALGSGISGGSYPYVYALASIGTDLYVGGAFTKAGSQIVNRIARWDGSSWYPLGTGVSGYILALATIDTDLYVGGVVTQAGAVSVQNIAKYNLSTNTWSALGSGNDNGVSGGYGPYSEVIDLATIGTDLYVGGIFSQAGSEAANNIARWDGSSWHTLDTGVSGGTDQSSYPFVQALATIGTDLYVGGRFTQAGSQSANNIAKWDGNTWSALNINVSSSIQDLMIYNDTLYIAITSMSDKNLYIYNLASNFVSSSVSVGNVNPISLSNISLYNTNYLVAGGRYDLLFKDMGNTASSYTGKLVIKTNGKIKLNNYTQLENLLITVDPEVFHTFNNKTLIQIDGHYNVIKNCNILLDVMLYNSSQLIGVEISGNNNIVRDCFINGVVASQKRHGVKLLPNSKNNEIIDCNFIAL